MGPLPHNKPRLWDRIIADVAPCFGGAAIVAGGAVRDHVLGRRPKDIDVFVPADNHEGLCRALRPLHGNFASEHTTTDPDYMTDPLAMGAVNLRLHGMDVQVVGMRLPEFTIDAVLARFDFGLCQAAYCQQDGTAVTTPAFQVDAASRTFTLVFAPNGVAWDRSVARFNENLAPKFPDYRLVTAVERPKDPDDFDFS